MTRIEISTQVTITGKVGVRSEEEVTITDKMYQETMIFPDLPEMVGDGAHAIADRLQAMLVARLAEKPRGGERLA